MNNDKFKVEKEKIIIVEGIDEKNVIQWYLDSIHRDDVQLLPIGGKTQLSNNLSLLRKAPKFETIQSIAILRDADRNPAVAFQSVKDSLTQNGFIPPNTQLQFSNGNPRVLVFVLPGETINGALEDILLKSEENNPIIHCVNEYFNCLKMHQQLPDDIGKAKIHTLLASKHEDPAKRVGEAAQAGWWNWDHEAFQDLRDIIDQI